MKFEQPQSLPENKKPKIIGQLEVGEKPDAFIRKMELLAKASYSKVETIGEKNLETISPGKRVIFVTTHITNADVPIALSVIGQKFHLAAGDASTHRKFSENPFGFIGTELAGGNNFIPVSHRKDEKTGETGVFNPEDFEKMSGSFEENKAVILSAYYKDRNKKLELPDKGGYGAAYLAEISNAVIVPVAINIKSKEHANTPISAIKATLSRPEVEVIIGKPFELQNTQDPTALKDIMTKRQKGELSKDDVEVFKRTTRQLRGHSDILMQHLAELLPEEKQGKWGDKDNEEK